MNGPEHYAAAEALLDFSIELTNSSDTEDRRLVEVSVQQAQVHATLALTAATADGYSLTAGAQLLSDDTSTDAAGHVPNDGLVRWVVDCSSCEETIDLRDRSSARRAVQAAGRWWHGTCRDTGLLS